MDAAAKITSVIARTKFLTVNYFSMSKIRSIWLTFKLDLDPILKYYIDKFGDAGINIIKVIALTMCDGLTKCKSSTPNF